VIKYELGITASVVSFLRPSTMERKVPTSVKLKTVQGLVNCPPRIVNKRDCLVDGL